MAPNNSRPAQRLERLPSPHDLHPCPEVRHDLVRRAAEIVRDIVDRLGYMEALWVAEELTFEFGVGWHDEKLIIQLSDLQLVAYAAALRAHRESIGLGRTDGKDAGTETSIRRQRRGGDGQERPRSRPSGLR